MQNNSHIHLVDIFLSAYMLDIDLHLKGTKYRKFDNSVILNILERKL